MLFTPRELEERWAKLAYLYDAAKFRPLPKQQQLLCSSHLYNLFCGGVGAGKSLTAAQFAYPKILMPPFAGSARPPIYWLVGENYRLPQIEFSYIRDILSSLPEEWGFGPPWKKHNEPSEGSWILEIEGICRIETRSWTHHDQLHGYPIQGMIVCEAGLLDPMIWYERLEPRLSRVRNAWCLLVGTLEDTGAFYKDLVQTVVVEDDDPEWFGVSMATWENTHVYPGGAADKKIEALRKRTPPDIFQERYGAVPKRPAAIVYREFSHKYHVGRYPFDRHRPVAVWIDPGGVYALNAVQRFGDDFNIIDEIELRPGTSERAITEAVSREWWPSVTHGVMDATQVEARTTWTSGAIWEKLGVTPVPIYHQKVPVESGIELVRTVLHTGIYTPEEGEKRGVWDFMGKKGIARLHIDSRCERTIYEFAQGYKRKKLIGGRYSDTEVVKQDDHHVDAIRYGLAQAVGFAARKGPYARPVRRWIDSRATVPGV